MLTTKRFDYIAFHLLHLHPSILNHRPLNQTKVNHYADDILHNGLLEPLVVWERNPGDFYLVGGFHRYHAILQIRAAHPGYFDRIDVRVVHGDLDEIQALNLKLNADRLDAKISDYFDAVVFMANANWNKNRIARFLDKSEAWIDDILRYAPRMDARVRRLLENGAISWAKAKTICKAVLAAPPGRERDVLAAQLHTVSAPPEKNPRPLTLHRAIKRFRQSKKSYRLTSDNLADLLEVLRTKNPPQDALDRVRKTFPALLDEPPHSSP